MNAIGEPMICVIMKIRTPSSANANAMVYSRPKRSDSEPHMILATALVTPARVAVSGTIAMPKNVASKTFNDFAICDMLPVVISPPVHTIRNMMYMM